MKLNIKDSKIYKEVKGLCFNHRNKEFLTFLFCLFVAAGLWVFETLGENGTHSYEIVIDHPKNMPADVKVTDMSHTTVRVDVNAKCITLVKLAFSSSWRHLSVDYTLSKSEDGCISIPMSRLKNTLKKNIQEYSADPTADVGQFDTETVEIYCSRGRRRVPVKVLFNDVTLSQQRYISEATLNRKTVMVYAPEAMLNEIDTVYVRPHASRIPDTDDARVNISVPIDPIKGARIEPSMVNVQVTIDRLTEKRVKVPISCINFPPDKVLRTFPQQVEVAFIVGMKDFNRINADNFVISVSYDDILNLGDAQKLPVELKSVPSGVLRHKIVPSSVDFLLEELSND